MVKSLLYYGHMSNVNTVHNWFRGITEIGKTLRITALVIEILIGIFSLYCSVITNSLIIWQPIILFIAIILTVILRSYAARIERFAQVCRRESCRAYAMGEEIKAERFVMLKNDVPFYSWVEKSAGKLSAQSIDTYYDSKCAKGERRLREIYAHSAFFTFRLLKAWGVIMGVIGCISVLFTLFVIYWLAIEQNKIENTLNILNGLFSFVLGIISLRIISTALSACDSSSTTRKIFDELINLSVSINKTLYSLVQDYDMERINSPHIPTFFYNLKRDNLAKDWEECRKTFRCK